MINLHKQKLAAIYLDNLSPDFVKPSVSNNAQSVYHIFPIRHENRDELQKYLLDQGVKTEVHYPIPPQEQVALRQLIPGDYPISKEIHQTILSYLFPMDIGRRTSIKFARP